MHIQGFFPPYRKRLARPPPPLDREHREAKINDDGDTDMSTQPITLFVIDSRCIPDRNLHLGATENETRPHAKR